mmetsp:Transcript_4136/g.6279  ORF Transcript_4136/g.6279 Transcript_4136/m.6279 type:complete len:121 (+) Transcript_4136:213-575(+)
MSFHWQRVIGGLSGCMAVGTSAYGAHGLKPKSEVYKKTFDTGARFQLLHSVLLVATPAICGGGKTRIPHVAGAFFSIGIALFSGSCYAVGITEDRNNGKAAPIGGLALMAGWLSLALVKR